MARRRDDLGGFYHEPPYTWEESRDFYRAMSGGPVTVVHLPAADPAAAKAKPRRRKSSPQPPQEARFADALNSPGVATARGGSWYPSNVRNVLARG